MSSDREQFDTFVQSVLDNLRRNGFPERKVAFPIEKMYEAAYKRGLSFNDVLDGLAGLGIAHEKTPEKVIFMSTATTAPARQEQSPFAGLDLSALSGMDPEQMMAAASEAMKQMGPEQLQAVQGVLNNMTEEQRAELLEQARKLGLF